MHGPVAESGDGIAAAAECSPALPLYGTRSSDPGSGEYGSWDLASAWQLTMSGSCGVVTWDSAVVVVVEVEVRW